MCKILTQTYGWGFCLLLFGFFLYLQLNNHCALEGLSSIYLLCLLSNVASQGITPVSGAENDFPGYPIMHEDT